MSVNLRLLLVAGLIAASAAFAAAPVGATATSTTDPGTLTGEGGSFAEPFVLKMEDDAASSLAPLTSTYYESNIDQGREDFVNLNSDFAVTELPLNASEANLAANNGLTFAYVPFAASAVALGIAVDNSASSANYAPPDPRFYGSGASGAPEIKLSPLTLEQIFTSETGYWYAPPPTPPATVQNPAVGVNQITPDGEPTLVAVQANRTAPVTLVTPSPATYVLTSYFESNPQAQAAWSAWLGIVRPAQSATSPTELWPANSGVIDDQALANQIIPINPETGDAKINPLGWGTLGAIAPLPIAWTVAPWYIPTAEVENQAGSYVKPTLAATEAALADATLDPNTNLVTFTPSTTDTAAYPLVMVSYLVVPTAGLLPAKATALASLINFFLSPQGTADIESFGAAPVTPAMVTADKQVVSELMAEASPTTTTTTSTTTTTASTTTTTTVAPQSSVPQTPQGLPSGFTVAASQSIQPGGGTFSTSVDGVDVSLDIPAGDFSLPTTLVLTVGPPSSVPTADLGGRSTLLALGVSFEQGGVKVTGSLKASVVMTITDPHLAKKDSIVDYDASTATFVAPTSSSPVTVVKMAKGSAVLALTSDPAFALESPAATAAGAATSDASANPSTATDANGAAPAASTAVSTSPAKTLAYTGVSPLPVIVAAAAMVVLGESARRRRRRSSRAHA